jgi:hypothetical protein
MSLVYVIMFKFTTRPCETISNNNESSYNGAKLRWDRQGHYSPI